MGDNMRCVARSKPMAYVIYADRLSTPQKTVFDVAGV
jgi:hypothetical protein